MRTGIAASGGRVLGMSVSGQYLMLFIAFFVYLRAAQEENLSGFQK